MIGKTSSAGYELLMVSQIPVAGDLFLHQISNVPQGIQVLGTLEGSGRHAAGELRALMKIFIQAPERFH
jgi:hypothetical protein